MLKTRAVSEKRVLVGVSGGVDSAVALALLKKNGFAAEAVFFNLISDEQSKASLQDAKKICKELKVLLHIENIQRQFEKKVVKYFLDEYSKCRIPNPCIYCNEHIKFKLLLKIAKKLKINLVATGHYAIIKKDKKNNYKLFSAQDEKKDQAYFLYRLKQDQLAKILFPLGEYQKEDVRKLAKKFNLAVFDKSDSQDVCFMAKNDLKNFLNKKINLKSGDVINPENKIIGRHNGLALYAIGQRKGISIGGIGPYFVIAKKIKKNILVVTNNPLYPTLFQTKIQLKQVSWTDVCPKLPLDILVRTHYLGNLKLAVIININHNLECWLEFKKPQKTVSQGQSVVFYNRNKEIIGGGIVKRNK